MVIYSELSTSISDDMYQQYDYLCKKILSNKQILAYILKECVEEFKDIAIKDIPKYIDSTQISQSDTIQGKNTEDQTIPNAKIVYDILFEASVPNSKENVAIIINIEAQNQDNPGYPLLKRAIYYCARLLDRQKNSPDGFQNSNFTNLKKVYSIWICKNHSSRKNDVINQYKIQEFQIAGNEKNRKEDCDLINITMMYLNKAYTYKENEASLLKLLHILFVESLSSQ